MYYRWANALCLRSDENGDKKMLEEALTNYRKAFELGLKSSLLYQNWAIALRKSGDFEESTNKFERASALSPNDARTYNEWGIALYDAGDRSAAIGKYEKAIAVDPWFDEPYYNLGLALEDQGKREEAIDNFQKAIEVNPQFANAYDHWGLILKNMKKIDQAVAKYQRRLSLMRKTFTHTTTGEPSKKIEATSTMSSRSFRKAIEIDPSYADAHCNLGLTLKDRGNLAEATSELRKAAELDSKSN